MKKTNSVAAIVVLGLVTLSVAVSGAAQDIPALQREGVASPTLSGCVARGTATGTYTLTTPLKKDAPAPKPDDQPLTVALKATEVDLAPHVGHSVTLTGSYEAVTGPVGTAVGTAGTTAPPSPPAAATAAKDLRTFTVKSLKMVAPSCSGAAD